MEFYALDKISEDTLPINPVKYKRTFNQLEVWRSQVKRPITIVILLSSWSNFPMSEKVKVESNNLKLYQGPLGLTISSKSISR